MKSRAWLVGSAEEEKDEHFVYLGSEIYESYFIDRMKILDSNSRNFLAILALATYCLANSEKQKRQIYREQLLPALGGKIPEEAFRTDRLALNRLNKEGITIADGVLLEARDHDKNPDSVQSKPEVIKVYVTEDHRYVPPEGRHHDKHRKSVDTTYVLRKPIGHHGESQQQRLNGIGNAPAHHQYNPHQHNHQNTNINNNNNNAHQNINYGISSEIPPQELSPPKAHGYSNFHSFVPHVQADENHHLNQHEHYKTIYKPIITPLIIPARGTYYRKFYQPNFQHYEYQPTWETPYDWTSFYHPRESLFLEDNTNFFDTHQIITDYEGFLDSFHGRSYRHIDSPKKAASEEKSSKLNSEHTRSNSFSDNRSPAVFAGEKSANSSPVSKNVSPSYTNLTSIPITNFSCDGKKGTFADVETKCQVFHECSGWSKTSSLCPAGTAYSAIKKRCEWWNTVICDAR